MQSISTNPTPDKASLFHLKTDLIWVSILLVLFMGVYYPVLFMGKTLFSRDIYFFNYPLYHFLHEAFQEGFLPFWNPKIFLGVPFYSALQFEVFYPPSLLYFMEDFTTAFNLQNALHHLFLTVSVYGLCRFWGLSGCAAFCSAVTAFFGGYFLSLLPMFNHFHAVVWVPVIFISFELFLRKGTPATFLFAVLMVACQTLAGSPETSVMTALLVLAHSLVLRREDPAESNAKEVTAKWGGVMLFALGLTAIQLVPTYLLLEYTDRKQGFNFLTHSHWSLQPQNLLDLLNPLHLSVEEEQLQFKIHNSFLPALYMGSLSLFFLASCLHSQSRKESRFWCGVFGVGLFFALGKHNPLYVLFFDWVPWLDRFRFPEKFFFLCAFGMVFLAGYGVQGFLNSSDDSAKKKKLFWIPWAACMVVLGIVPTLTGPGRSWWPAVFLLFLAAIFFLKGRTKTNLPVMRGLLGLLFLIDLVTHNHIFISLTDRSLFETPPSLTQSLQPSSKPYRIYSGFTFQMPGDPTPPSPTKGLVYGDLKKLLYPTVGTLFGQEHLQGSLGIQFRDQDSFDGMLQQVSPGKKLRMLELMNVKYLIPAPNWDASIKGKPPELIPRLIRLNPLPRVIMTPHARAVGKDNAMSYFIEEGFDPLKEVLLDAPPKRTATSPFEGSIESVIYRPNAVEIRTRQSGNGYLVMLDQFFPGWQAYIDDQPSPLLRANNFFRAVHLDSGDHLIRLEYQPAGFQAGLWITLVTLILLILSFILLPKITCTGPVSLPTEK